ncbi:MAG: O-antigen ligase family protein [Chloroflexi bacterium]|nr:O-antigen ligase family protein [Chloroflexota bacterium]
MPKTLNDYLALAIRGLIVLILFTPLIVTEKTLFPFVVGKAVFIRIMTELAFALWVALALRDNRYLLPRNLIIPLFLLYLLASLISAVVGVSFQHSFWGDVRRMGGVFALAHWFLFLVVLVSMVRTTRQWRWLLSTNLGVSLLVGILAISEYYNLGVLKGIFWYLRATGRVDVTFGNADYVGAYTALNTLVALAFLADSFLRKPLQVQPPQTGRRPRRPSTGRPASDWTLPLRTFWAIALVTNLWVLSLSGARGALGGLVVALFVAGVVYSALGVQRRLRIVAGALAALMLGGVLLAPIVHNSGVFQRLASASPLISRLDQTFAGGIGRAYESRRVIVEAGLRAFPDAPIFGWGPENFSVVYDRYGGGFFVTEIADQAHSKPVEELTNKGLFGFALYLAILGVAIWYIYRKLKHDPEEELLTLFLGAAFVGYIVQNLFLFDTPGTYLQFVLLLGWVAATEGMTSTPAPQPAPQAASSRRARRETQQASVRAQEQPRAALASLSATLSTPAMATGVSVAIGVLALFSILFINIRSYRLAAEFPVEGQGLAAFTEEAKRSVAIFPPLATLPRVFIMDTLAANWQAAGGTLELLASVMGEGEAAIAAEPQNARIYMSFARLLQEAAPQRVVLLEDSRELLDKAKELGPRLPALQEAEERQNALEALYRAEP